MFNALKNALKDNIHSSLRICLSFLQISSVSINVAVFFSMLQLQKHIIVRCITKMNASSVSLWSGGHMNYHHMPSFLLATRAFRMSLTSLLTPAVFGSHLPDLATGWMHTNKERMNPLNHTGLITGPTGLTTLAPLPIAPSALFNIVPRTIEF